MELSKEQEVKFREYQESRKIGFLPDEAKRAWLACLEANNLDNPNLITIDLDALDWPEWAESINVIFATDVCDTDGGKRIKTIERYPRPAPAWEPKEGEPVFVRGNCGIRICKAITKDHTFLHIKDANGNDDAVELLNVKPFDTSKIGKPWEEI